MAAGDITNDLVDELQTRMRKPEGDKFTDSMCMSALNHGQIKTALFLHHSYLTELETKSGTLTAEANVEPYDESFDPPMLNGGAGLLAVASSDNVL